MYPVIGEPPLSGSVQVTSTMLLACKNVVVGETGKPGFWEAKIATKPDKTENP
jgi:hypothetical protein